MTEEKVLIITRGEKITFDIFLEKADGLPRPVDLTNFDAFKACFLTSSGVLEITDTVNANGSSIDKVSPDVLGQLRIILGADDTSSLETGYGKYIDIEWDNATTPNPKRRRLHKVLNVEESECS